MARSMTCPNCGTTVTPNTIAEQAYDAYVSIVVRGKSSTAWASEKGLSKSTATLYRRLGIAVAALEIPSDSTVFKHLNPGALIKEVGAAIEAPDATATSVTQTLRRYVNEQGHRVA